ncbi:uncharacterized protein LOC135837692 [Planococcus citri]|uniref:uncharacterized protein LOC135837692 n=1 Tax=Planococcus citri TaxID=170843 RepID=UPI0031F79E2A
MITRGVISQIRSEVTKRFIYLSPARQLSNISNVNYNKQTLVDDSDKPIRSVLVTNREHNNLESHQARIKELEAIIVKLEDEAIHQKKPSGSLDLAQAVIENRRAWQ